MTDFKVGQKALWGDTIVTVDYVGTDIIVGHTENGEYGIRREYLTPIPLIRADERAKTVKEIVADLKRTEQDNFHSLGVGSYSEGIQDGLARTIRFIESKYGEGE